LTGAFSQDHFDFMLELQMNLLDVVGMQVAILKYDRRTKMTPQDGMIIKFWPGSAD